MLELYSQLLSHLNAEENDMALEFEAKLIELLSQQDQLNEDSQFLQCLKNAGVDNWDGVSEIVKVEKVTETITVTKWKPILDENVPAYRPQQPQSKVCLPQQ